MGTRLEACQSVVLGGEGGSPTGRRVPARSRSRSRARAESAAHLHGEPPRPMGVLGRACREPGWTRRAAAAAAAGGARWVRL